MGKAIFTYNTVEAMIGRGLPDVASLINRNALCDSPATVLIREKLITSGLSGKIAVFILRDPDTRVAARDNWKKEGAPAIPA
jgi:hypothetical protein